MRKVLKSKRGDISAPIITMILVIASISIAALIVSWLYGVGISASKQAQLIIIGTPTIQQNASSFILYITVKNTGTVAASIISVSVTDGTTTYTTKNFIVGDSRTTTIGVSPGATISFAALFNATLPRTFQLQGVLQSTAGTTPFIAVVQK